MYIWRALKSPVLTVMDAKTHEVGITVGPFGNVIRPFTVNGEQSLCFVNVNGLLGFEVGDLRTGKVLHRVELPGGKPGTEKRHGCPSHGIGLTPDDSELWLTDAANSQLHIFDSTVMPPKRVASVTLRDQPGWVTFGTRRPVCLSFNRGRGRGQNPKNRRRAYRRRGALGAE